MPSQAARGAALCAADPIVPFLPALFGLCVPGRSAPRVPSAGVALWRSVSVHSRYAEELFWGTSYTDVYVRSKGTNRSWIRLITNSSTQNKPNASKQR